MASSSAHQHPLFTPLKVGNVTLKHRIAMAPLTRLRASADHVPLDIMVEHFAQRAVEPGTLLISDATPIAQKAGGYPNVAGIYNEAQIKAWRKVTDAVHARGSFIFLQLWATGRGAHPEVLEKEALAAGLPANAYPYISSSAVRLSGRDRDPRPLTIDEIKEYTELFAQAAENAVVGAGFDGVEIHGANGYLIDQFLQTVTNNRTDAYGGSVDGRTRFALEVVSAVVARIGAARTALRVSPWSRFNYMGMAREDVAATYAHLAAVIRTQYPEFAYLHAVEGAAADGGAASNDFLRRVWKGGREGRAVFVSAQGHSRESALRFAEEKGDGEVIAFGQWFTSNPDLVRRIREDIPFTPYDPTSFYTKESPVGYVDYPYAQESVPSADEREGRIYDVETERVVSRTTSLVTSQA